MYLLLTSYVLTTYYILVMYYNNTRNFFKVGCKEKNKRRGLIYFLRLHMDYAPNFRYLVSKSHRTWLGCMMAVAQPWVLDRSDSPSPVAATTSTISMWVHYHYDHNHLAINVSNCHQNNYYDNLKFSSWTCPSPLPLPQPSRCIHCHQHVQPWHLQVDSSTAIIVSNCRQNDSLILTHMHYTKRTYILVSAQLAVSRPIINHTI